MKLSKLSIPYRAGQAVLTLLAFGLFTGVDIARFNLQAAAVLLLISFIGLVGTSLWFYLVWKKFEFEITEDTFDIRSGVLNRRKREIPLKRIQNADIRRNIVHRMLGIAKVNIETAGGKSTEASLKYVDLEVAKDVQRRVRQLKQNKSEAEDGSEPVFEISREELAILSLTSISGKAVAGVFVFFSLIGAFSGQIDSAFNLSALLVIGFTGIASLVIMTLGSALTNFSRYYDFKLFFRGDSLEYERGLINRSEGSIPLEKIQGLSIEENPLQRYFSYATLKVETAGYGPGNQENTGAEVAIPLAEKEHVKEFSRKILEHPGYKMQKVSNKALRRYFGRYILASTVFTASILTAVHLSQLGARPAFFALLVPLSAVAAYLKYVNRGFYEGEGFFYTRNGFWNRKTSIVPYYRIQTLIQEETVFQRRLGLASIVLDTAGTSLLGSNPKACDLDSEVAEKLFERIYSSFQDSRKIS